MNHGHGDRHEPDLRWSMKKHMRPHNTNFIATVGWDAFMQRYLE